MEWNKCSICCDKFSSSTSASDDKTPIQGSCGHCYCRVCVAKLHCQQSEAAGRKNIKRITCPECREKAFHIDNLTPNRSLCAAVESMVRNRKGELPTPDQSSTQEGLGGKRSFSTTAPADLGSNSIDGPVTQYINICGDTLHEAQTSAGDDTRLAESINDNDMDDEPTSTSAAEGSVASISLRSKRQRVEPNRFVPEYRHTESTTTRGRESISGSISDTYLDPQDEGNGSRGQIIDADVALNRDGASDGYSDHNDTSETVPRGTANPEMEPEGASTSHRGGDGPTEENDESSSVPGIVKKELADYHRQDALQHRKYGDRVLLARQAENGMMKLGGGNCKMELYPSEQNKKNENHPRYRDLGDTKAMAYTDSWHTNGPKYAGQRCAALKDIPDWDAPFSVFMKRSMKKMCLGWEYCGEYTVEDPDCEIEMWSSAHALEKCDRDKQIHDILESSKRENGWGRRALTTWRKMLAEELEKDPSPASKAPTWVREGRKPTCDELEFDDNKRSSPLAARARALGFHPDMPNEGLAKVVVGLDEFHSSVAVTFVRYDERVYKYVMAGETTRNAVGKTRKVGEPCAKASDWYRYYDMTCS